MRDLGNKQFSANSPMRNYIKLSERVDELQTRLRRQEQMLIEAIVRLNELG